MTLRAVYNYHEMPEGVALAYEAGIQNKDKKLDLSGHFDRAVDLIIDQEIPEIERMNAIRYGIVGVVAAVRDIDVKNKLHERPRKDLPAELMDPQEIMITLRDTISAGGNASSEDLKMEAAKAYFDIRQAYKDMGFGEMLQSTLDESMRNHAAGGKLPEAVARYIRAQLKAIDHDAHRVQLEIGAGGGSENRKNPFYKHNEEEGPVRQFRPGSPMPRGA